jgi:hypothetical protein
LALLNEDRTLEQVHARDTANGNVGCDRSTDAAPIADLLVQCGVECCGVHRAEDHLSLKVFRRSIFTQGKFRSSHCMHMLLSATAASGHWVHSEIVVLTSAVLEHDAL